MASIFEKLNLKDQKEVVIVNAPPSFEPEINQLEGYNIRRSLDDVEQFDFLMVFATHKKDVDRISPEAARKACGDVIIWLVYPKGTSKKYQCDFNRDNGFDVIYGFGYQPVRMVAIDQDWSALRVRRIQYIKKK